MQWLGAHILQEYRPHREVLLGGDDTLVSVLPLPVRASPPRISVTDGCVRSLLPLRATLLMQITPLPGPMHAVAPSASTAWPRKRSRARMSRVALARPSHRRTCLRTCCPSCHVRWHERPGHSVGGSGWVAHKLLSLHQSSHVLLLVYPCAHPTGSPLLPLPLARHPAGVWNSYAANNNNTQLWEFIWTEDTEGGICTGLSPNEWMRRAVQLRRQYNPDVRLSWSSTHRACCVLSVAWHACDWPGHLARLLNCPACALTTQPALLPCSGRSRQRALLRATGSRRKRLSAPSALHMARTCTWSATKRELSSRHACRPNGMLGALHLAGDGATVAS